MFLFTCRGSKSKGKSPRARFEDSPLSCNICTNQTRDYLTLHKSLSSGGQQISKIPIHLQCLVTDKGREFVMLSIGIKRYAGEFKPRRTYLVYASCR